MTTIVLSEDTKANNGAYQVYGVYRDQAERFVFDVRNYPDKARAEVAARHMMRIHEADHFERRK